jgi:L-arabinose isomerase
MDAVTDAEVRELLAEWQARYDLSDPQLVSDGKVVDDLMLAELRFEVAVRKMCADKNAVALTTAFENLGGVLNLPGAGVQNMMFDGFGFGPEGHFVVAHLVWLFKTICTDMLGYDKTTLAEDYVLQFPKHFIAAHMLELCPSTSAPGKRPVLKRALLDIGSHEAVRLVFDIMLGIDCTMTSVIYRNSGFQMVIGEVASNTPPPMLNMPVAKALLQVKNSGGLALYRELWMEAMGPHHSALTQTPVWVQQEVARQLNIPCLVIGQDTTKESFMTQMATQSLLAQAK